MSETAMQEVVCRLRQAVQIDLAHDGVLLDAFVGERSETAFAELVQRHGPMVWGVCWRLLSSRQDAEDCYQATFLVLIRKAETVRPRSRVGAWLHGVAYHTALKARHLAARRIQRERPVDRLPEPIARPDSAAEMRQLLDRGLHELPEKYRIPIILCELEGRTLKDVAEQLGSPIGTVAGWLSRGRELLARRLAKHGLSAVALSAIIAESANAAPPVLSETASRSASTLADATIRSLFLTSVKSWLLAAALVLALAGGLGWMYVATAGNNADGREGNAILPLIPGREPEAGFVQDQKKNAKGMITKETQKAIDDGLTYLAKEQTQDGSWGMGNYKGNVAITGLAGLAFLSGNHQSDRGDYGKVVTKAVKYVLSQERADTPGFFCDKGATHGPMYHHGFAVLFLADAHQGTTDKKLKAEIKSAVERAVKLLIACQNQEGGWRYTPNARDADISVSACQIAALAAAHQAGIVVPKATSEKALEYVKKCQHPDNGGFRYQASAGASGFARTAAALTALDRLGAKGGVVMDNGLKYLRNVGDPKDLKNPEVQMHYFYGHYYAAKAMWYAGDDDWKKWYPKIRDEILDNRKEGKRWSQGTMDPHYCTAMALIILQIPHAHLPSLKR